MHNMTAHFYKTVLHRAYSGTYIADMLYSEQHFIADTILGNQLMIDD